MNSEASEREKILSRIRVEFAQCRGGKVSQATRYSLELRRMAVRAISFGFPRAEVAEAAGVSEESLKIWGRIEGASIRNEAKPVELKVVKTPRAALRRSWTQKSGSVPSGAEAKIRFKTGVCLRVPLSALTVELIMALNGGDS